MKLYHDKHTPIVGLCKGKSVLDLGIVDHDVNYEQKQRWLHRDLKNVARSIIGADIDRKSIQVLKKRGYAVVYADVEDFDLEKQFDVVVAGDLVEHLNNPGKFLTCVKKHMHEDSLFVITTPNCLSFSNWLELVLFGKIKFINEEHTLWHDANTLKRLLNNYGFRLVDLSFVIHNPHFIGESKARYFLKNMRHVVHRFLTSLRPQLAPTLYVVCKIQKQ